MLHSYTRTGNYNISRNYANQDAVYEAHNSRYVFIALADGVSECEYADRGACTACCAAADIMLNETERVLEFPDAKLAYLMIEHIRYTLEQTFATNDIGAYSSTLAFALVDKKTGRAILFNLGDGAAFRVNSGRMFTEMMPKRQGGLPAQTTTSGAHRAAEVKRVRLRPGESLMLFSDGMTDAFTRNAPVMENVRSCDFRGIDREMEAINTDDDASYIAYRYR